jgi:hypothetical protein
MLDPDELLVRAVASALDECGLAPDRIARTIVIDLYLMIARLAEQLARGGDERWPGSTQRSSGLNIGGNARKKIGASV